MAITRKSPVKSKAKSLSLPGWTFTLFGLSFGYFLSKGRATDYDSILNMFLFREFQLFGLIATAILVTALGIFLLKKKGGKSVAGEKIEWNQVEFRKDRLIGAALFGVGWALSGACPGTAVAQLGEGKISAVFTVVGILVGVWAYRLWMGDESGN